MVVQDAFVQRFLTEGFLTLTPDVAPGVMQQIDKWLKEMTPPVVTSEEEGLALEKKVIRGVERGYLVMDAEGKVTSANGKRTSEYDNTNREDPVLCAPTWILSASMKTVLAPWTLCRAAVCRIIRIGNRPELDDLLEAPNVKATLTALLGENYMVDSDRGSNFTVPGRKANTDWHRDGNDVCPMMAPYIRAAIT
jgi:hypothetical protein